MESNDESELSQTVATVGGAVAGVALLPASPILGAAIGGIGGYGLNKIYERTFESRQPQQYQRQEPVYYKKQQSEYYTPGRYCDKQGNCYNIEKSGYYQLPQNDTIKDNRKYGDKKYDAIKDLINSSNKNKSQSTDGIDGDLYQPGFYIDDCDRVYEIVNCVKYHGTLVPVCTDVQYVLEP